MIQDLLPEDNREPFGAVREKAQKEKEKEQGKEKEKETE
jgi:hypothetical protein